MANPSTTAIGVSRRPDGEWFVDRLINGKKLPQIGPYVTRDEAETRALQERVDLTRISTAAKHD